uniref:Uncharacterized protein n=1 Tax=Anguilla anguilla TaxID=7936 RepID=A0A0E9WHN1_ANGAN
MELLQVLLFQNFFFFYYIMLPLVFLLFTFFLFSWCKSENVLSTCKNKVLKVTQYIQYA